MKVSHTKLSGVLLIKPDIFWDKRGEYVEIYNKALYAKRGIPVKFIQDDISLSRKNVLRGIHGDNVTWKLISCLYGEFYLVVVNCDRRSKYFGRWQAFRLSGKNRLQVLVPPKYGNAHFILSPAALFHYKQSTYYDPKKQFTYKWDDPRFRIRWPFKGTPILSERDKTGGLSWS